MPDLLSGLIWVQTVCKGYQQTTKVATNKERVESVLAWHLLHTKLTTVKPVLSGHSNIDSTKVLKPGGSLMQVESIAECSTGTF